MFNGIFTKNINQMIIIVIRGKTKVIYAPGNVSVLQQAHYVQIYIQHFFNYKLSKFNIKLCKSQFKLFLTFG
jgi:hypothetical protein